MTSRDHDQMESELMTPVVTPLTASETNEIRNNYFGLLFRIQISPNGSSDQRSLYHSLVAVCMEGIRFLTIPDISALPKVLLQGMEHHQDDGDLGKKITELAFDQLVPMLKCDTNLRPHDHWYSYRGIMELLYKLVLTQVFYSSRALVEAGCVAVVAKLMKTQPHDADLDNQGLRLLQQIQTSIDLRTGDMALVMDVTARAMERNSNSSRHAFHGCLLISAFIQRTATADTDGLCAETETLSAIFMAGGLRAAIGAIKTAARNSPDWEHVASSALPTVAAFLVSREDYGSRDECFDIIITAIEQYGGNPKISEEAFSALVRVLSQVEYQYLFKRATALQLALLDKYRTYLGNECSDRMAEKLDDTLASVLLRIGEGDSKAHTMLSSMLEKLPPTRTPIIQLTKEVFDFLNTNGTTEDKPRISVYFVAKGVLTSMDRHQQLQELQEAGLAFLANLAVKNSRSVGTAMQHARGVGIIFSTIKTWQAPQTQLLKVAFQLLLAFFDIEYPRVNIEGVVLLWRVSRKWVGITMAAIQKFQCNIEILDRASRLLFRLCRCETSQYGCPPEEGRIRSILRHMKDRPKDRNTQIVSVLQVVVAFHIGGTSILENDADEVSLAIVLASRAHSSDALVQRVACLSLSCLCEDNKAVQTSVLRCGSIDVCMQALKNQLPDLDVQQASLRLCERLLAESDIKVRDPTIAALKEYTADIVRSLSNHPRNYLVQRSGLNMLQLYLSFSADRQCAISEDCAAQALGIAVAAIQTFRNDFGNVQFFSAALLRKLLVCENRRRSSKSCAESEIVMDTKLLDQHACSPEIAKPVTYACRVLFYFVYSDYFYAQSFAAILTIMENFATSELVQQETVRILRVLSQSKSNTHLFESTKALSLMKGVLVSCPKNENAQEDVSRALRCLAPWVPASFGGDTSSSVLILKAIDTDLTGSTFGQHMCKSFDDLAELSETKTALQEVNGVYGILLVMDLYVDKGGVQVSGLWALVNVTSCDGPANSAMDWDQQCIDILLRVMQKHIGSECIQELCCKLLLQLTSQQVVGRDCILEILSQKGARKSALLPAIIAYPSNFDIFDEGGSTFFRIKHFEEKQD